MIPGNLQELVTFVPNKEEPIHNWFYYKEGYAKKFVEWAIVEFGVEGPVLGPFCGVGTPLLACKQMGLKAIGFDVSPLAAFVAEAKTRDYAEIENIAKGGPIAMADYTICNTGTLENYKKQIDEMLCVLKLNA